MKLSLIALINCLFIFVEVKCPVAADQSRGFVAGMKNVDEEVALVVSVAKIMTVLIKETD